MEASRRPANEPSGERVGLLGVLLGAVLVGAVVFGLVLWGRTPTHNIPAPVSATPANTGVRLPMPTGDLPGWRAVFSDDFTRPLDRDRWSLYWGRPGGDPVGWYDPTHVSVSDGTLVISAYRDPHDGGRWATGGLSTSSSVAQTYGKYLVRFRLDRGVGIAHALLLTPVDRSWPPEVDFSEDNGSDRRSTVAALHYGPGNRVISKGTHVDLTQWHTLGVEWLPGLLRYTLDGRVWLTMATSHVPRGPMVLGLQSQTWPCAGSWERCPDQSTPPIVRMYVDWVVAYARAG